MNFTGNPEFNMDDHNDGACVEGFAEVNRYGNNPSKGTTNMKSRGTDTALPGQGSPPKSALLLGMRQRARANAN